MKREKYITRAVYAEDMKKPCPYCLGPIERDDLIMVEKVPTGKQKKAYSYDYIHERSHKGKRLKVLTGTDYPEVKKTISHKKCWFENHGQEMWYYPGVLAEDNPQRRKVVMKRNKYNPAVGDHDINISLSPPAVPAAAEQSIPKKNGFNLTWWLIFALFAGGGVAGYWFFYRHKYNVGQILQHLGDSTDITYQIIELKYVGITHTYVLQGSEGGEPQEYSVSQIDKDPAWMPI